MDDQHRRPPFVRLCPEGHRAYLRDGSDRHYCHTCRGWVDQLQAAAAAAEDLDCNPAHRVPEKTQRRWWRWLTTWGPRLAAAVRGEHP